MANEVTDISEVFLSAAQHGNLNKLSKLTVEHNIKDWTIYRHKISGDTALHMAAREGHLEVVKYLCNNWTHPAFKVNAANKDMKRPLHEASQFSHSVCVDFLIQQGASIDPLKRADWTPLMLACTKNGPEALECVISLLKAGADAMIGNKDGWLPLHIACRVGNIDIIKLLLKTKPDSINKLTKNGRTVLHIAAFHGCLDAIDLLIATKSELIELCDSSGSTPLHEAVKSGNFESFRRLIKFGADSRKVDTIGQTLLHTAASIGNFKVIDFILKHKLINIDSEDHFHSTPLAMARRHNVHASVVDLLLNHEK